MNKSILIFSILLLCIFSMPTENAYATAQVEYLVIAGGGGGSTGGGGAGGYLTATGHVVTVQTYPITIGAGGAGGTAGVAGSDGSDSVFDTITATGGGGGGHNENNGRAGGSGGGGGADSAGGNTGGAGTGGQGNNGGATTHTNSPYAASGGGGAGAVGQGSVSESVAGSGGAGLSSSINGTAIMRAGGGGGGVSSAGGTAGAGGSGGGGDGNDVFDGTGTAGAANTGGGGGGSTGGAGVGGAGGSGIVILRYLTNTITATGGTITTDGAYTVHTFTTSGNFDVTGTGSPPNPVTVLNDVNLSTNSVDLEWDAPTSFGAGTFQTYTINYTTPWGQPETFLANSTNLYYNVTGLIFGTDYSFRVAAITEIPGNNTGAYILNITTTANTYSLPPTSLVATSNSATQIDLQWVASTIDNILGYRIERETPSGTGWATIVANTTNTNVYYNNTGLTSNIIYNYRVSAMNASGFSSVSNTYAMTTFHLPDAVTDLTGSATDLSTIDLSWTAPTSYAPAILGYMINGTTPTGEPVDVLNSNTSSTATTATALNLLIGQEYSFRVSPITIHGKNATGNIWNGSTIQTFVIGNLSNPDITNDDDFSIFFDRTDVNASAIQLDVTYPNSYNLSCDFDYKYARTNQTYSGLTTVPDGADDQTATFTLINATGDLVQVRCWDVNTGDESTYVITITDFPFLEQIRSLRNGDYGTFFQIGAFDGVMLIIIFLGMVGLNRTTPIVGVIFVVITIFTMAYFELITYPIIMYPAMIMMIVWAFVSTRKDD